MLNMKMRGTTVEMKKTTAILDGNKFVSKKNNLFFRTFERVKYELPIFILLFLFFIPKRSDLARNDVYVTMLIFDYRIGFAPRLFIGSVMSLFTDYKSLHFMNNFMDIFCVATLVLFAIVAGRIIRKAGDKAKEMPIFFIILFIVVPYTRAVLFPGPIVSFDRFLVVFTLLALIAINKKVIKWFVPILIFMGLATYQGFAFTYMPVIAILLIYEIFRNKKSKESIALCVVAFTTMAVFSVYFFLYHGIDSFKNVDELLAYAANKTDLREYLKGFDIRYTLNGYLFTKPATFFWSYIVSAGWKGWKSEVFGIIYLMPIFVTFFIIWKNSIKSSSNKAEKFIYILCILAPLARLPMFLFSTNFLRGRASIVVVQFFLVFYFLYIGNKTVAESAKQVVMFFRRHILLFILMVVYCIGFIKLQ